MRHFACMVVNPITVDDFASLFNCTREGRSSNSSVFPDGRRLTISLSGWTYRGLICVFLILWLQFAFKPFALFHHSGFNVDPNVDRFGTASISRVRFHPSKTGFRPQVVFLLTISRWFLCCCSSFFVCLWFHMWRLFCPYLFLISPSLCSGGLCFVNVAFPWYIHLYILIISNSKESEFIFEIMVV